MASVLKMRLAPAQVATRLFNGHVLTRSVVMCATHPKWSHMHSHPQVHLSLMHESQPVPWLVTAGVMYMSCCATQGQNQNWAIVVVKPGERAQDSKHSKLCLSRMAAELCICDSNAMT
jgi:hypothetical protein